MKTPSKLIVLLALIIFSTSAVSAVTVLIDFGNDDSWRGATVPSPDPHGNYWNSVKPGSYWANLVDTANAATSIAFGPGAHPTDSYNGPAGATSNPPSDLDIGRVDIDTAALGELGVNEAAFDYHAGILGSDSGYFSINGLDPGSTYTITLFGSHKYVDDSTTRINVFSDTDRLNLLGTADFTVGSGSAHNRDTLVVFADLVPGQSGGLHFEFGGADGVSSGYLNCLSISTEGGGGGPIDPPDPEPDEGTKLVVAGSSVPVGFAASLAGTYYHDYDQEGDTGKSYWDYEYAVYGYAGRLRNELTNPDNPRLAGGSTTQWEFVNVSVPGDNTTLVRNRFDPDVTRQYQDPKVAHSEPGYVILALSLANEGLVFTSTPQDVFDSFRDGLLALVQECETRGYYPIVTLAYPHADYTPEKYEFVKQMNVLINSWGVTSINLLGAIDNGHGQWADGFWYDPGHPNFIGHEEMYYAIPPTMLDAIHFDGKNLVPDYPDSPGSTLLSAGDRITFEPDSTMRSFTSSFQVKTAQTGIVATVEANYQPSILVDFGPSDDANGRATASPDAFGQHWNSWRPAAGGAAVPAGTTLDNVVNVTGNATDVTMEVVTAFGGSNGLNNGGLFGSNGPDPDILGNLAVESATEDYFYTTGVSALKISGLDPQKRYTFRFFGSRATDGVRETRYRVTGTTAEINYSPFADILTSGSGIGSDGSYNGNDSAIGLVSGIQPKTNGEIFVEVLLDPDEKNDQFAYLGLMEISVEGAIDRTGSIEVRDGSVAYVSPAGRELVANVTVNDDNWHDIALSHRYAQQQTILYIDGVEAGIMRENIEPSGFSLGASANAAPASFQDWAIYRAAWTDTEAAAQFSRDLQNASMEILAPLDDAGLVHGQTVANLAQSRSEAVYRTAGGYSVSYWADIQGDDNGNKNTGFGLVNDTGWPYVFHFQSGEWMGIIPEASQGVDSFYAYVPGWDSWIWSGEFIAGFFYDFSQSQWMAF